MLNKCLMCDEEYEHFWHAQSVPGNYCSDCIGVVIDLHEFFQRYNIELIQTFQDVHKNGYDFNHKKAC